MPTVCGHANHGSVKVHCIWPGYTSEFEAFTPNSSADRTWKSFQHYRRTVSIRGFNGQTVNGAVRIHVDDIPHQYDYASSADPYAWYCGEYGAAGAHLDGLIPLYDDTMSEGFVPPHIDIAQYTQAALRATLPYIKPELSLVNSVIELKDFKTLPKTLSNVYKLGKSLLKGITFRGSHSSLRRLLHAGADGYLQAEFNILPLLSDIAGIRTAISKTSARVNALVNGQGRTQKRHYRRPVELDANNPVETTFISPSPPGANAYGSEYACGITSLARRFVYTDKAMFHFEIEYNYNFTRYQVENAQLLGMLDALGVNLNPAIIWNAIPWSFVVDWVIGVSRWLGDRAELNMEPVLNIQRSLWSVTYERRIVVSRRIKRIVRAPDIAANEYVYEAGGSFPVVFETAYRRDVGIPSNGSVILSGLSPKEFSLGAALVITNKKHHRKG